MTAISNRIGRWVKRHAATVGFVILSGMVVLALYLSYRQTQDRDQQVKDLTAATQQICEVARLIDSATVQLAGIDTQALADRTLSPAAAQRFVERIDVFNNLHDAIQENSQPCREIE
jgi:hypothetical protein